MFQDLRYGIRMLYRNPGFTAIAIFALALGIGVNTSVFTAYKAMVARPLDARDASKMVNIALARGANGDFAFSYPDYQIYRDSTHAFSGLVAFSPERMSLSDAGSTFSQRDSAEGSVAGKLGLLSSRAGNTEFASVFAVSENYFQVLGVAGIRGRSFESLSIPELAASPSILISENYWEKRLGKDPALLGKSVRLNGAAFVVIGVTPKNFVGTGVAVPDFWLPISLEPLAHGDAKWLSDRENRRYRLFGRLASGVGISQAQSELTLLAGRVRTLHDPRSESAKPTTVLVWPGSPFPLPLNFYPGLNFTILLIMAAAAMVLVVACSNVASLQLARARSRENELRTRQSLGAARARIVRQLLTESALMSFAAGVTALLFSSVLLKATAALVSGILPADYGTLVFNVNPDLEIFAYAFGISLAAGLLFGLAPAIESTHFALSASARSSTASSRSRRIQNLLLAGQVALSLVLMMAGSMFIRGSIDALKRETGYDARHLVDLDLQFPEVWRNDPARKHALVDELRTRLAALPDVAEITSAQAPADSPLPTVAVPTDEKAVVPSAETIVYYTYVEPNYFHTLGIPLLLGRGFQAGTRERSVVLSEAAAKQLWPGLNPLGRTLRLGPTDELIHGRSDLIAGDTAYQVAGVARDVRGVTFDGSDSKKIYLPLPENLLPSRPILIRTHSDAAQGVRTIDSMVLSVAPDLPATSSTLQEMARRTGPFIVSSLAAAVASSLGLLGLALALMGIYGTVSYIVVLRTREVGIRMAVGAQQRDILGLILGETSRPVLGGMLAGFVLGLGVTYWLRRLLYGLNSLDAASLILVSFLFAVIALLAAYPPARRALSVDPNVALRYD